MQVKLLSVDGDDRRIAERARLSYDRDDADEYEGLVRYLMEHHHCYAPGMQVLTRRGWIRWDECKEFEDYAVPDQKDRSVRFERLKTMSFDHDGEMCCFENQRVSYEVTANHRMLMKPRGGIKQEHDFQIYRADEMPHYGHLDPAKGYSLPSVAPSALGKLLGFSLGDGCFSDKYYIAFHLKKKRKIDYLKSVTKQLSIQLHEWKGGRFGIKTKDLGAASGLLDLTGKGKSKRLAVPVESLSSEDQLGLLDGLINSDGSRRKTRNGVIRFTSTSPHLINYFETISALFGFDAHMNGDCISSYGEETRTSLCLRGNFSGGFYRKNHTGKVYCTTTSTGLLVVRGGSDKFAFICGNSGPFEFCSMQFEITASLAVVRQLTRHRTFSFNEVSMRYVEPPETSHYPATWRIQGGDSKQGSVEGDVTDPELCHHMYNTHIWQCRQLYDRLIENKVCREQARLVIPQAQHTRVVVKADLHNLLHYLRLRLAPDCQAEHRAVAEEIARHVEEHFPVAWAAFQEFRLNAVTFSATEMKHLGPVLHGADLPGEIGGSKRRARAFARKVEPLL